MDKPFDLHRAGEDIVNHINDLKDSGYDDNSPEMVQALKDKHIIAAQQTALIQSIVKQKEEVGLPRFERVYTATSGETVGTLSRRLDEKNLYDYYFLSERPENLNKESAKAKEHVNAIGSSNIVTEDDISYLNKSKLYLRMHPYSEEDKKKREKAVELTKIVDAYGFKPKGRSKFSKVMSKVVKIGALGIAALAGGTLISSAINGAGAAASTGASVSEAAATGISTAEAGTASTFGAAGIDSGGLLAANAAAGAEAGAASLGASGIAGSLTASELSASQAIYGAGAAEGITNAGVSMYGGTPATTNSIASGALGQSATDLGVTGLTTPGSTGAMDAIGTGAVASIPSAPAVLGPTVASATEPLVANSTLGDKIVSGAGKVATKGIISAGSGLLAGGTKPELYGNQPSAGQVGGAGSSVEYLTGALSDWETIYGPTQEALGKYYSTLNPDDYAVESVNTISEYYQKAQDTVDKQLAQRGLNSSGAQAQSIIDINTSKAHDTAEAIRKAPEQVAQQQQSFLNVGLQQQSNLQNTLASAYNADANRSLEIFKTNNQITQSAAAQDAASTQAIASTITTAVGGTDGLNLFDKDTYGGLF